MGYRENDGASWTLLTGHGHVLVEIARDPSARIRDIAAAAGITERTAQAIVADLEAAGYLKRERTGRRTTYALDTAQPFRHRSQEGYVVGPLLRLLTSGEEPASRASWDTAGAPPGPASPPGAAHQQIPGVPVPGNGTPS